MPSPELLYGVVPGVYIDETSPDTLAGTPYTGSSSDYATPAVLSATLDKLHLHEDQPSDEDLSPTILHKYAHMESFYAEPLLTDMWETFMNINGMSYPREKLERMLTRVLDKTIERYQFQLTKTWGGKDTEIALLVPDAGRKDTEIALLVQDAGRKDTEIALLVQDAGRHGRKISDLQSKHEKEIECLQKQLIEDRGRASSLEIETAVLKERTVHLDKASNHHLNEAIYWRNAFITNNAVANSIAGGSITRAACWLAEEVVIGTTPHMDPHYALSPQRATQLIQDIGRSLNNSNSKESHLYPVVHESLVRYLDAEDVKSFNTANSRYLRGEGPDISLCQGRATQPHEALIHGVIEVKRVGESVTSPQHLGQVKDYLLNLAVAQQGRPNFWGFLTNMNENILIVVEQKTHRGISQRQITKYVSMSWPAMFHYIRHITKQQEWVPPKLRFHQSLGNLEQLLSSSSKWQVGQFSSPDAIKASTRFSSMVVKVSSVRHTHYHIQELKVLRHLFKVGSQAVAPDSVSQLVWDPARDGGEEEYFFGEADGEEKRIQFGITPPGRPLNLGDFNTWDDFSTALDSIVNGLEWLHRTAGVVHRDIRPENVVLHGQTAVIIDFDCAFFLPSTYHAPIIGQTQLTTYGGGLICIPTRVLDMAINSIDQGEDGHIEDMLYTPEPQDDLCSFVLLVQQLLYPIHFSRFPLGLIRERRAKVSLAKSLLGLVTEANAKSHVNSARKPGKGLEWKPV
ncbi:hypothetical protein EV426DRAFT_575307 [Tirmania nivea]|nr:hypothetical protein EV426DRAFT_575307 [Tirmania nivea]